MIGAKKMSNIDLSNHIAISSNESPEQAFSKNTKILNVTWFLGKRCNFNCSYCSSLIHDNYSPHIKKEDAFKFIDGLNDHCINKNKKFKINFTGGEPFVHPNFLEILEYVAKKSQTQHINVVTNGSMPLETYILSSKSLHSITFSLHFEQSDEFIYKFLDKILILNEIENWFLNINVMALPKKFNILKDVITKLEEKKVKFVLKKIDPPDLKNYQDDYTKKLKKDIIQNINDETFLKNKKEWRKNSRVNLDERYLNYYSSEELEFLNKQQNKDIWPNIKVHFENHSVLANSEELKLQRLNNWKNWTCFIGLESLFIEHDGSIYRAVCMEGKKIGHINKECDWPKEPVICGIQWCVCTADICTTKIKNKKYITLKNRR